MGDRVLVSEQPSRINQDDPLPESAVYSYVQSASGDWLMHQQLKAPSAFSETNFGIDMDVDADTLVIGAPGGEQGSLYLYDAELLPLP